MSTKTLWTIGHSNRSAAEFVDMLASFEIQLLADVRRFPGSRRQPQFKQENLESLLEAAHIEYEHWEHLGGRRQGRLPDSPNGAWRVESFNTYADYMLSDEFQAALHELTLVASKVRTAIMCAEAVPWRCHRRLIADALTAQGWTVRDIYSAGRDKVHKLTEFARVEAGALVYPEDAVVEVEASGQGRLF